MKKLIIVINLVVLLASCKRDLLDTTPYGTVSSETMWTTDGLTDLGVNGVYHAMRLNISTGGNSDRELYQMDRLGFTGQKRDGDAILTGTTNASSGMFSNTWRELYEGVNRANDAIAFIPQKSPSAPEKKARLVAECKFLRAYYYSRLNQLFQGVPVYLEPLVLGEANKTQETEEAVWDVVIKDLTDCIAEPALPNKYTATDALNGHVTKGAAYALRGKAYMYKKQWALAAADFQKVKDAGYALFTGSYRDIFQLANEKSNEMIFTLQHINQTPAGLTNGYGSTTQFFCGTRSSFNGCWNVFIVSPNLVDLYENANGTKFNWDDIIPGYNAMPPAKREVYFFRNNLTAAQITAATTKGLDMSLYLPNGNEQRLRGAYLNRDPRLEATVITPYASYLGRPINGSDQTFVNRWPSVNENPPFLDLFTDSRDRNYYLYRKYVYEGSTQLVDRASGPTDFPIIRYADVVLMWAEALTELGNLPEAITLVNSIRSRAGVALLNSSPATTVTGQTDLRDRIRNERRVEFPNEGINYFDELRWKTWKEKVFATGNGVKEAWGANVVTYSFQGDYIYRWPVPTSEIQINPNLKPTPGWIY